MTKKNNKKSVDKSRILSTGSNEFRILLEMHPHHNVQDIKKALEHVGDRNNPGQVYIMEQGLSIPVLHFP